MSAVFLVSDFRVYLLFTRCLSLTVRSSWFTWFWQLVLTSLHQATPFFTSLAQEGTLDYPVFGVGLTRSEPWGTLALGGQVVSHVPYCY